MNAIFSYIVNHAYSWLKILFFFTMFDLVFRALVATVWLDGLLKLIWYIENLAVFKLFPEEAMVFMTNVFMLAISIEIIILLFGRHDAPGMDHSARSHR